jgi:hypothetical protein
MNSRTIAIAVCFASLTALGRAGTPASGQPTDAVWAPLHAFVGRWTGVEIAGFGQGAGTRSYRFILQDRYLLGENASRFPPQEGLPDGDRHDDWALFSYDRARDTIVLRQFNSEGFVNVFAMAPVNDASRLVFVLESSENGPAGLSGSLTYEFVSADEFVERFELSTPDLPEMVRIRNRWRRE